MIDTLIFSTKNDAFEGNIPNSSSNENSGKNIFFGSGKGDDKIMGSSKEDFIFGSDGNDEIKGEDKNDIIVGGVGDDKLYGGNDKDALLGDLGKDELYGNKGDDLLYGGIEEDKLFGGSGDDELNGGADKDVLLGGRGNSIYTGGEGDDVFVIERGMGTVTIKDAGIYDKLVIRASDVLSRKQESPLHGLDDKNGNEIYNTDYIGWGIVIETGIGGGEDILYQGISIHWSIRVPGQVEEAFWPDYIAKFNGGNLELTFYDIGSKGAPEITVIIENFQSGMLGLLRTPKKTLAGETDTYERIEIPIPDTTQIGTKAGGGQLRQIQTFVMSNSQPGDDHLIGSDDDDSLFGLSGNDTLEGNEGVDFLDGGAGDDALSGGTGDDELTAGPGSDTYFYAAGDGSDIIDEFASETDINTLVLTDLNLADVSFSFDGASGFFNNKADLIITILATGEKIRVVGQFFDVLSAGDGVLNAGDVPVGLSQIEFADGSILDRAGIEFAAGFYVPTINVLGTEAAETLTGDYSDNWMKGFGGDDTINGETGYDRITGGTGSDTLNGGAGNDTFVAEVSDGDDIINGGDGAGDTLDYFDITSPIVVNLQNGTATGADIGSDTLSGIENVWAAYSGGSDTLIGSAADNVLDAGGGNDTLTGNLGDDTLSGGNGSDTYNFVIGDGDDFISDDPDVSVSNAYLSEQDIVVFGPGINLATVTFERQGPDNVRVVLGDGGGSIVVGTQLRPGEGIERFEFTNGTSISAEQLARDIVESEITNGADEVLGTDFNDTIAAGLGDDRIGLVGTGDIVVYASGDGNDVIETVSPTELRLTDLNPSDVLFSLSGLDLLVTIIATSETIRVKDHHTDNYEVTGLGRVTFADATIWDREQIFAAVPQTIPAGTAADEIIAGFETDDVINGAGGNDKLYGFGGNDTLVGGSGADKLYGQAGDDTLNGGEGDDTLEGGQDNNSFIFAPGFGKDTITDFYAGSGTGDIIEFDQRIFANFSAVLAASSQVGYDTLITYDENNTLTLTYVTLGDLADDDFRFVVGEPEPNIIYASAEGGYLSGTDGVDHFIGAGGSDTFYGAKGSDIFEGGDAAYDQVDLDGEPADWTFSRNTDGSVTAVRIGWGTLSLKDIDGVYFYGSQEWASLDSLIPGSVTIIHASAEGGYLQGSDGNDHFIGAGDNDTFYGAKGDDLFEGGSGGQDQVDLDGEATDWTFSRNADGTVTAIRDGWGTLNLKDIDAVYFYGSAQWSLLENLAPAQGGTIDGTANDDNFIGTAGNDEINGLEGNDVLSGLAGNDALYGGLGDDELAGGEGDDELFGDEGADTLDGGAGHDLLRGHDGDDILNGDDSDLDAGNDILSAGGGNDTLNGFAGNDILYGEAGNDILVGGLGNDQLYGNEDDDTLTGGAGNDVFVFASGFGKDTITDFLAGSGTDDVIEFDDAVFADLSAVLAAASQVGADTLIAYDANNTITLKNVTMSNLHADDFRFV